MLFQHLEFITTGHTNCIALHSEGKFILAYPFDYFLRNTLQMLQHICIENQNMVLRKK
jgi:hypothetical protein